MMYQIGGFESLYYLAFDCDRSGRSRLCSFGERNDVGDCSRPIYFFHFCTMFFYIRLTKKLLELESIYSWKVCSVMDDQFLLGKVCVGTFV